MVISSKQHETVKLILQVAAAGGFLATAIMMPNVAGAIAKLVQQRQQANRRYYVKRTAQKLTNGGFITVEMERWEKAKPTLTRQGRELLEKYQVGELKITKPKSWD